MPVACDNPGDKHHVLAWALFRESMVDGTYELVGPPIGGNADGAPSLAFKKHGDVVLDVPRNFDGLRQYLTEHQIEGVVFAHPDGRMCKIRRVDFGLPWGASQGK